MYVQGWILLYWFAENMLISMLNFFTKFYISLSWVVILLKYNLPFVLYPINRTPININFVTSSLSCIFFLNKQCLLLIINIMEHMLLFLRMSLIINIIVMIVDFCLNRFFYNHLLLWKLCDILNLIAVDLKTIPSFYMT